MAGLFNGKGLGNPRSLCATLVVNGRGGRTDNGRERVVFLDNDHHAIRRSDSENVCLRDRQGHAGGVSNSATGGSYVHNRSPSYGGIAHSECERRVATTRCSDWAGTETRSHSCGQARGGE